MNNWKIYLIGGFSFVSMILSIVTFCSFDKYDYDKTSALMSGFSIFVASLGVIVTLLITWQIYNSISIQKIKEETSTKMNDVLYKSNLNQLLSLQGLANFYTAQYNSLGEEDLVKIGALYFAALLNWSMTIDLSWKMNQAATFTSSVASANSLVNDNILEKRDRYQLIQILTGVPEDWKTTEFQRLYNTLLNQDAADEDD